MGVNDYPGTNSDLAGCINDANDWAAALHARGFQVTRLLDGDATKRNIVDGMRALVASVGYAQCGVVTWSGHGTWIPDLDDDESDQRDEAWCPHDIQDGQLITDDEIAELCAKRAYGARIVLISDSCHSGTVNRLFGPIGAFRNKVRFLAPEVFLAGEGRLLQRAARTRLTLRSRKARLWSSCTLLLSGCQDTEYSYDAWFGERANGAFTYVALRALEALGTPTYQEWMARILPPRPGVTDIDGPRLPSHDYPQTPKLSGRLYMQRRRALA